MNTNTPFVKRTHCAVCHAKHLKSILNYGPMPLAGIFPKTKKPIPKFPLELLFCSDCSLLQTNGSIDPSVLFEDYRYRSSIGLQSYFNDYARFLVRRFQLSENSRVLEIGSNDGVLLKPLQDLGISAMGIDPSKNISQLAIEKGCQVIVDFFSVEMAKARLQESTFDLVTASNCFAHIDDIHSFVQGVQYCLKEDGYFIVEVHYGKNIITELQYDNVYHEHQYYYSVHALHQLFTQYNMTIVEVEETPLHAGSLRVVIQNTRGSIGESVNQKLAQEKELKLHMPDGYSTVAKQVETHKKSLQNQLDTFQKQGKKVAGFGASGRTNILCHSCNIGPQWVRYIIDESPERYNRFINTIPTYNLDRLERDIDIIVIFSWNYSRAIIRKLKERGNFNYLIPFPTPQLVANESELSDFQSL